MLEWIQNRLIRLPDYPESSLNPDAPFYAVGDIHGQIDLQERILAKCDPCHPVVFVGDYIDRGDSSAQVLDRLFRLQRDGDRQVICLSGNHEKMLLMFLEYPETKGAMWLRNGGLQTLASFGITDISTGSTGPALAVARNRLGKAMGADLVDWLQNLPLVYRSGNIAVIHAAADPEMPIEDQLTDTLIWGHRDFFSTRRRDGVWVVHGHTIMDQAVAREGRISIDTGAYATGRLSAAFITKGKLEFITS